MPLARAKLSVCAIRTIRAAKPHKSKFRRFFRFCRDCWNGEQHGDVFLHHEFATMPARRANSDCSPLAEQAESDDETLHIMILSQSTLKRHSLNKFGRTSFMRSHAQLHNNHEQHVNGFVVTGVDALLGKQPGGRFIVDPR
jgi:hypothetical protein